MKDILKNTSAALQAGISTPSIRKTVKNFITEPHFS